MTAVQATAAQLFLKEREQRQLISRQTQVTDSKEQTLSSL